MAMCSAATLNSNSITFKSGSQKPPGGVKRLADSIVSERENGTSKAVLSIVEPKQVKALIQLPVVKKKRKLPKTEGCNDNLVAISPESIDIKPNPATTKTASKPNNINAKCSDGDDDSGGGLGGLLSYASSEDDGE